MKRFTTLLALALILAFGTTAYAAKANKANKPTKADRAAKKAEKGVTGTVLKVDGTNIVVQTKGKQGGEVTIATDANTKFTVNGKDATIADVKAGESVTASPAGATAQKVTIKEPRQKGKGAKPAKNKNA